MKNFSTLSKQVFEPLVGNIGVSATLGINMKIRELKAKNYPVTHFGFGQSPFPIAQRMVEQMQKYAHIHDYLPCSGLPDLLKAIAEYHEKRDGIQTSPDQILVAPGSKELLFTIQHQLQNYQWNFARPSWVSYGNQSRVLQSKNIQFIQAKYNDRWLIDLSKIGNQSWTIMNNPNNPTGLALTEEENLKLARIAKGKQDSVIIADEIYNELQFDGKFKSFRQYLPEQTVVTNGISKWACSGGWRLGYALFPKSLLYLKKKLESVVSETYSCVSAPVQYGAIPAFDISYMEPYLKQQRKILNFISNYVSKELQDAGVKVHTGEGGFYLYVDFENFTEQFKRKGINNSKEMCIHLLENYKTALLAGEFFHDFEGFRARLAYVDFEGGDAIRELTKYDLNNNIQGMEFLNNVAPNVKDGVDRMKLWLKDLSQ